MGLGDVGEGYLQRWKVAMGLSGLPISEGGRLTGASSSTSNTAPPGVCVWVCWGPELWLFLPDLGIRKQLCPPSWDPRDLNLGGGPPSRCFTLWQNLGSGR